jgi:putative ABC transport system substrate-binding protein
MRRREFITLLGGAAAWPLAAYAQQPERVRRIVVLEGLAEMDPETRRRVAAFQQGLLALGWTEGRNVSIDYRFGAVEPSQIDAYAAELVALAPDVILASTTLIATTLLRHTHALRIVFVNVVDPVATGLVTNLARPGGNITGFTNFESTFIEKWMSLLKEIAPRVTRVAVIFNSQNPSGTMFLRSIQAAGSSLGVQVIPSGGRNAVEIEGSISAFAREPGGGLIVLPEPLTTTNRALIIGLAATYRLPAIYVFDFFPREDGLMSYGIDRNDLYQRAASYVNRILKGEKPADLPVQQPTKFKLVINLRTAKALGLTVPPTLITRADEVIE